MESYNHLAGALLAAVSSLGLPVQIKEGSKPNHETPNPVCFEVPSAYEITIGGKKLIGSAQARRKEGVLQHGSLPLSGSLARITDALTFTDEPARQKAALRLLEHATTVESILSRRVSWEEAAEAFITAFKEKLNLSLESGVLSESEQKRTEILIHDKYNDPDWMRRV
jgi:lipoate-protein ligase A